MDRYDLTWTEQRWSTGVAKHGCMEEGQISDTQELIG